jgi:hypothetical protein
MSLEKRLRTRPRGVVSKNDIGALKILVNIVLCSFVAAIRVATIAIAVATMTENDWQNPRTP